MSERMFDLADGLEFSRAANDEGRDDAFVPEKRLAPGVSLALILGVSLALWAGIWELATHLL